MLVSSFMRGSLFRLLTVLLLLVPVSGLAQEEGGSTASAGYTIGPGDVLDVQVYRHDEISGKFPVKDDGTITYPYLDRVAVAGLTTAEVARKLEAALEKDYYVDVQLQVEVAEYRSKPVTLIGEVGKPGTYYLEGRTTLTQLLADAGGLRSGAGRSIELRRRMGEGKNARMTVRLIPRKELLTGGIEDVVLQAGDVISVPPKALYFVTGEVASPGQYELNPGETLMQALSKAGGLAKFASSEVEIHRGSAGEGEGGVLTFNLRRIRHGKERDPEIQARDVIVVKRRVF